VVVTHDLECAHRVGERLMLIEGGQIVFEGNRQELESSNIPAVRSFLDPAEAAGTMQGVRSET
jgi:ABC-type transporter Mla maintaining outer membrane lipid asymmetry ATPase subunit MlaF